jgi:hypothetical protein
MAALARDLAVRSGIDGMTLANQLSRSRRALRTASMGHEPALLPVAPKVGSGSDCGHSYGSTAVIGHTSDFTPAAWSLH